MIETLPDVLESNGVQYKQSGDEITICCPFCVDEGHSQDTRFRLGINLTSGKGHCFNCGWRSRYAAQIVGKKFDAGEIALDYHEVEEEEPAAIELPEEFGRLHTRGEVNGVWEKRALRYVMSRGMTQQQIKSTGVGMALSGKYAYRIIFPVRNEGELCGMVARSFVKDREPKYLNAKGTKAIWNLDAIDAGPIILTEGIFKSLALERMLKKPCAAILGRNITEVQVEQLMRAHNRTGGGVILWPDPGQPGIEGFLETAQRLENMFEVWMPWPAPDKEADEMEEEEIRKYKITPYDETLEMMYLGSLL